MKKCLPALFAALLFCGVSHAGDGEPTESVNPNYAAGWEKMARVAQQLKGRMLCNLVHKGMTREQVKQILGRPMAEDTHGQIGYPFYVDWTYFDLGLYVHFKSDENDVARMTSVDFSALFK